MTAGMQALLLFFSVKIHTIELSFVNDQSQLSNLS